MNAMKRFATILLLLTVQTLPSGCGGQAESPAPGSAQREQRNETPERSPGSDDAGARLGEIPVSGDEPLEYAPTNRFDWPEEFRLPLIIDPEVPEVPEGIRGPSPPIEGLPL